MDGSSSSTLKLKNLLISIKNQYEITLEELHRQNKLLSEDNDSLKEQLTRLKNQLSSLKIDNEKAVQTAHLQSSNHKLEIKRLQEELKKYSQETLLKASPELENRYALLAEEYQELSSQFEEIIEQRQTAEKELKTLSQDFLKKQEDAAHLSNLLAKHHQEFEKIEEKYQSLQLTASENENKLKIAQQHLAKKLKETAILSEKIEEYKIQYLELQNQFNQILAKNSEQKNIIELQKQQEKLLQEQFRETLRTLEIQCSRWERKYSEILEKWQRSEAVNQELRKSSDEKYQQVQNILASFMNPKQVGNASNIQVIPFKDESKEVSENVALKEEKVQNLFEIPPLQQRYKPTFFDE